MQDNENVTRYSSYRKGDTYIDVCSELMTRKQCLLPKTNPDRKQAMRGDIIRKAFEELDVLGRSLKNMIIEEIERSGIVLDSKNYYSLGEIENRLQTLFSKDGTELLLKQMEKALRP
jgi:hypothetical protein